MSRNVICIEGGGDGKDSKAMRRECCEGFRRLLEKCGFEGRMPRLVACGSRKDAFDDFKTQLKQPGVRFVGLLVDSEDSIEEIERTWEHLKKRPGDNWEQPDGTADDQVLLMTTCMETWIVADRATLKSHYKKLQVSALPSLTGLEQRHRHEVHEALERATKACKNSYKKGTRSFEVVGLLGPTTLAQHLPSFARMVRILHEKLGAE